MSLELVACGQGRPGTIGGAGRGVGVGVGVGWGVGAGFGAGGGLGKPMDTRLPQLYKMKYVFPVVWLVNFKAV